MQADVFCRVVDNFGDIGVTWRLVRQLQREHNWSIRLWVDDLTSFQRLEARVHLHALQQVVEHIEIIYWSDPAPDLIPYPFVLCSFSCDLPETYIAQLHLRPALWLNLEYLSAETWVEGCHKLPSLRGDGLSSYFFFPGFNAKTGGLIREQDLLTNRDLWQKDLDGQRQMLARLKVSAEAIAALSTPIQAARLVTLFCYPQAPVAQLLEALCAESRASVVLVPQGVAAELVTGRLGPLKHVYIERIPFVSQPEYDQLLAMADLNFVRGEDSIVRALWAGRPLVWQIYPQTEDTHLVKLEAWLEMSGLAKEVKALLRTWNAAPSEAISFVQQLNQTLSQDIYAQWSSDALTLSHSLAQEPDFAQALHDFCESKINP